MTNSDNSRIESIMQNSRIELILFEISEKNNHDVEMIGNIKNQFPNIPIIVMNVDGDDELMIKAYIYLVIDIFKKPYKYYLIVERVNAIFDICKQLSIVANLSFNALAKFKSFF